MAAQDLRAKQDSWLKEAAGKLHLDSSWSQEPGPQGSANWTRIIYIYIFMYLFVYLVINMYMYMYMYMFSIYIYICGYVYMCRCAYVYK